MDDDRIRWEGRYAEQELLHGEAPSRFLVESLADLLTVASGRRALDIACGEGRNSLFLARNGFQVTGLDISAIALERARQRVAVAGLTADFQTMDLDHWRPTESYDLIVNINYLQRELITAFVASLSPGGLLLMDTIMAGANLVGTHNPAYLLAPGELQRLVAPYTGEILRSAEYPDSTVPHAALLFRSGL